MNYKFNGARLKQARIYRGLTVNELAEITGCKRQTLSMYEIGKSQPTEKDIINRISSALAFPPKYFYEWPDSCATSTVYFRSLLTTSQKYRKEQAIKIDFVAQVYELLQDYIEFPKYKALEIPDNIVPETAANMLRDAWGLKKEPIKNLVSVVEQNGILVTSFSSPTNYVDAFSRVIGNSDNLTFIIAYSDNKTSAARIHFDVAHELGHICLHEWHEDIESLSKEEFKKREQQANNFAAAFLLPEETFRKDAESGEQTLVHYKKLKQKWGVSMAAMIRRSASLNIISYEKYQELIRIMQRRGMRKEEPLDDKLHTAPPALLGTAVMMLLQNDVFTPEEFMKELSNEYKLSIAPEEIENLLNLPSETLSSPKVIDFASMQLRKCKKSNI